MAPAFRKVYDQMAEPVRNFMGRARMEEDTTITHILLSAVATASFRRHLCSRPHQPPKLVYGILQLQKKIKEDRYTLAVTFFNNLEKTILLDL